MKITQHIAEAKSTLFSFELLPPLKGENIQRIHQTVERLMEFDPAFVDVTYHREEYVYHEVQSGLLQKRTVRKRPGTVGICAAISHKYNIDTVPHIICGGFTKEETENALIDLDFVGVDNVLVLRGDPIRSEGRFKAEADGHSYAIDLLNQVADMNRGKYLDPDLKNSNATQFCIGVAGYPEKHFEAPNLASDLRWLKRKVEDGAEYVITQMFFDNAAYFDFVAKCRKQGIDIPI
ncbi:MAG: methylenetetrahydrofolate reductase, partial [Flavobacteriales bacterium]